MGEETSRPGAGSAFPETRWSQILGAGEHGGGDRLEALARVYWRPVCAYIRARWAKSDEDAFDAAQDFFLWMIESGFLSRADPGRGRFRGFMKASLSNFLSDVERRKRAIKRGGERTFLAIHGGEGEPALELPDAAGRPPDEVLDDVWRAELVERATASVEHELRQRGKSVYFDVFRDYFLSESDLDYASVARIYGISTVDVSNHLTYAKKLYRLHLRRAVMETVRTEEDLAAEMDWLFGGAS